MNARSGRDPSSIKEIFQSLIPDGAGVIQGIVSSVNPVVITAVNDEKLLITESILIIPRLFTDYETTCDISLGAGTIESATAAGGQHPHGTGGTHGGHAAGDGSHAHPGTEGGHIHNIGSFEVKNASMVVHNSLKAGDKVCLLSFNNNKRYFLLDKEG